MKKVFILILTVVLLGGCDKTNIKLPEVLTDAEIVEGLKEALKVGTDTSVSLTSRADGYFKNQVIKILLPPEAEVVESKLRGLGFNKLVDDLILKLNRAAEDAAVEAKPIFWDAITSMTITDGKNILFGDSVAATTYLKSTTYTNLQAAFQPKIKASLDKVGATTIWNQVFSTYNALPLVNPVNPNLDAYTTEKALTGLFHVVAEEEIDIREDPAARVNDILQKVFGELDK